MVVLKFKQIFARNTEPHRLRQCVCTSEVLKTFIPSAYQAIVLPAYFSMQFFWVHTNTHHVVVCIISESFEKLVGKRFSQVPVVQNLGTPRATDYHSALQRF
eukprot:SAG11_NODE_2671_length_3110_cov_3.724012_3_plen_102_part_00